MSSNKQRMKDLVSECEDTLALLKLRNKNESMPEAVLLQALYDINNLRNGKAYQEIEDHLRDVGYKGM